MEMKAITPTEMVQIWKYAKLKIRMAKPLLPFRTQPLFSDGLDKNFTRPPIVVQSRGENNSAASKKFARPKSLKWARKWMKRSPFVHCNTPAPQQQTNVLQKLETQLLSEHSLFSWVLV